MPYNARMNVSNLLEQGVELMMLGMGMVFFIFGLLVFVIKAVSFFVERYEPVVEHSAKVPVSKGINEDVVAAISIAVQRFRSK